MKSYSGLDLSLHEALVVLWFPNGPLPSCFPDDEVLDLGKIKLAYEKIHSESANDDDSDDSDDSDYSTRDFTLIELIDGLASMYPRMRIDNLRGFLQY